VNKQGKSKAVGISNYAGLKTYGFFIYLFLYFPLVIVVIFSFSSSRIVSNFDSMTLKWYHELFNDTVLIQALFHSFIIGLSAVFIALIFGTSGAFFITKVNFPGKEIFRTLVILPYLLPGIIIGITLLLFIRLLNLPLSWFTILLGHVSFTTPLVLFQVAGRLSRMGPNYQFAAQDLGANPFQTFWYVTLPMIKTALIGAGLLAFTVSFDEIVISYFLTGTWMTLPVYIYGMMRFGLSPKIFAISTCVLFMSFFLVLLMSKYLGRSADTITVKRKTEKRDSLK